MGNQHSPQDPKTSGQKGQPPKSDSKAKQDQLQQRTGGDYNTGSSQDSEHGSTRSYGTDQERAGDSGRKSHE